MKSKLIPHYSELNSFSVPSNDLAKPVNGPLFCELKKRFVMAWHCLVGDATAVWWV